MQNLFKNIREYSLGKKDYKNNEVKLNQLAAMFGLDARIALAIFGSLSVITGAALYKAIGQAKTVQHVTQAKEIEKAVEQYMLDTGSMLPLDTDHPEKNMNTLALITKPANVKGWKGPYLSYSKHASADWLTDGKVTVAIEYRADPWADGQCTKQSTKCSMLILLLNKHEENVSIEKYIDKTNPPLDCDFTGSFYYCKSWSNTWGLFKTQIPFNPKLSPTA